MTSPGATAVDIFNGTFSSFAVAMGIAGMAFLLGGVTGRKGVALGGASAFGIGGYVLYTLSNMTGSLKALTWISPRRWYVDDAMSIFGLTWNVALPVHRRGDWAPRRMAGVPAARSSESLS